MWYKWTDVFNALWHRYFQVRRNSVWNLFVLVWFNCNKIGYKQNMPKFNIEQLHSVKCDASITDFCKCLVALLFSNLEELCVQHKFSCTNLWTLCKNTSKKLFVHCTLSMLINVHPDYSLSIDIRWQKLTECQPKKSHETCRCAVHTDCATCWSDSGNAMSTIVRTRLLTGYKT